MTLLVLAYLGGVLTIVSPCILPVLPSVLARADRPFVRNGLPMLSGHGAHVAPRLRRFAAIAGGWVVEANQYGRIAALVLMALFELTLVFPSLAESIMQPVVGIGAKLSVSAERGAGDDESRCFFPLASARRCDRVPVGAVRRAGARPYFDRRRTQRRERRHFAAAAFLCRRGRADVSGPRPPPRRPRLRDHETLLGRRGVGEEGPGHRGSCRRRRGRFRARHRLADQHFVFEHRSAGTDTS